MTEAAERDLYHAFNDIASDADLHFRMQRYTENLQALASFKAPVDAFFDKVMVNAEDIRVRHNRLALLALLHSVMNRVADLSRLAQ